MLFAVTADKLHHCNGFQATETNAFRLSVKDTRHWVQCRLAAWYQGRSAPANTTADHTHTLRIIHVTGITPDAAGTRSPVARQRPVARQQRARAATPDKWHYTGGRSSVTSDWAASQVPPNRPSTADRQTGIPSPPSPVRQQSPVYQAMRSCE